MSTALFTYGSLMFPLVWEKVVTGRYAHALGTVHDHARYAVRGTTYPGMVEQPNARVEGVAYFDLSAGDLAALDRFEGDDYRRVGVTVQLQDGRWLQAQTYLFINRTALSGHHWDPARFDMQRFMQAYCAS